MSEQNVPNMSSLNTQRYNTIVTLMRGAHGKTLPYVNCYECFIDIVNLHSGHWDSLQVRDHAIKTLLTMGKQRFPQSDIMNYKNVLEWEQRFYREFYSKPSLSYAKEAE